MPAWNDRGLQVLRLCVLVAALGYIGLYCVLAALRVRYPFELEWLEGAMVDHVRIILAGEPLYARPSLAFTPLTYTPGYFYLAAALSRAIGVGFLPLRLISIAASAAVLLLLFALASRETRDWRSGVLAAGLFAAMYGWTDGWFDLARTDSLFLSLALLGAYLLGGRPSFRQVAAAGVAIGLSFLVKQTGLIVAVPLALYCVRLGQRLAIVFGTVVLVFALGTTAVLDRVFDGWYVYYVFDVPRQHPLAREMLWGFWRFDLLRPLPIALLCSFAYLAWLAIKSEWNRALFLAAVTAGLFGGAWASRLHSLSYVNVALPAYAALALVFAIAISDASRDRLASRSSVRAALAYALAFLQLVRLVYAPATLVPTAQDVAAGHAFIAALADLPGAVFVPYHGYLSSRAGKPTNAHAVVLADVIRGGRTNVEHSVATELEQALRTNRFSFVVATRQRTPVQAWVPFDRYYRRAGEMTPVASQFWPQEWLFVPK